MDITDETICPNTVLGSGLKNDVGQVILYMHEVENETNFRFLMDFLATFVTDMPPASEMKAPECSSFFSMLPVARLSVRLVDFSGMVLKP